MTKADGNIGFGYVISGYLNNEGADGVTVDPEAFSGHPFQTIEEVVAEIDGQGGPAPQATLFISAVVPVAIIAQPDWGNETIALLVREVEEKLASFVGTPTGYVLRSGYGEATPSGAPSQALNFKEGALD